MSNAKTVMSQAANTWAGPTYIEDVFSTYLYTGNGSTQTITNGIDLAGEGGMVWLKNRETVSNHSLHDSERYPITNQLSSNSSGAEETLYGDLTSFNNDGFTVGYRGGNNNQLDKKITSWTFRKAPRFFDVVTYTGDGASSRAISHNLGVVPGCIIIKNTSLSTNWVVHHRSLTAMSRYLELNNTNAEQLDGDNFKATSDTTFTVGPNSGINRNGDSFVAYLFAHDPLGPSGDGSDGLIACGSYTGNGTTTGPEIDLGWEPQWVLVKRTNSTSNWTITDSMRGFRTQGVEDAQLWANLTSAEDINYESVSPTPTGFIPSSTSGDINASGSTYIYIAIRRPMGVPRNGSEVLSIDTLGATLPNPPEYTANHIVDFAMRKRITSGYTYLGSRKTGLNSMYLSTTAQAEAADSNFALDYMNGMTAGTSVDSTYHCWMFKSAKGFLDVVPYIGTGVYQAPIRHGLGVTPEMMFVKIRDTANHNWVVYHSGLNVNGDNAPETDYLILNSTSGAGDSATYWGDKAPDDKFFYVGNSNWTTNANTHKYMAYLFASVAGVSKVGSYTGNGTSQTIDCGFTSGARFVLIKRASAVGGWFLFDTLRGIVDGPDSRLSLSKSTSALVTTDDSIDPDPSGFIVKQESGGNINVLDASYVFFAVS